MIMFSNNAEIRNSRTLAKAIAAARNQHTIETSNQFKEIILPLAQRGRENQYLARVYQALRIEVNDEIAVTVFEVTTITTSASVAEWYFIRFC